MSDEQQAAIYLEIKAAGLDPVYESNSLHVIEERYELKDKLYTIFFDMKGNLMEVEEYQEPIAWKALLKSYLTL